MVTPLTGIAGNHDRERNALAVSLGHQMGAAKVGLASSLSSWTQHGWGSTWAFYLPLFGTLINLGLLYWKRHSHPTNYILLSTFTLLEAFTLGVVVAFYDNIVVLQALCVITDVSCGGC